ncbi:MAG: hypothetical protein E7376_02290 [Clostridiales bacterium]|nr:hypothetical protein [Clostridiales bacterium]
MSLVPFLILHTANMVNLNNLAMQQHIKNNRSRKSSYVNSSRQNAIVKKNVLDYSTETNLALRDKFVAQCLGEIQKNDEIKEIVEKYVDKTKDLKLADEKQLQEKFLDFCPQFEQAQKDLDACVQELSDMGFVLDSEFNQKLSIKKVDNSVGFKFEYVSVVDTFNGRGLTKEQVLQGINIYQEKLDDYILRNPGLKEKLETAKKEYDELSKKKFLLKISKKKRERLEHLSYTIESVERKCNIEEKYRKLAEFYASLTKEQKQKLINYFDKVEAFQNLSDKLENAKKYAKVFCGKVRSQKDIDNFKYLISKRLEEAKKCLTQEEQAKLDEFCVNLASKIANATKEELTEMRTFDDSTINKNEEAIWVYKAICLQVKECGLALENKQALER